MPNWDMLAYNEEVALPGILRAAPDLRSLPASVKAGKRPYSLHPDRLDTALGGKKHQIWFLMATFVVEFLY